MSYETVSLRDYVGKALNALYDPRMAVLDGDLSSATRTNQFQQEHPNNFIECGISETSGVSIAVGLAAEGMIPFYVNFAIFCSGSAWTQVRMACYAKQNIKLLATHPGMDNGFDGASHHGNEDIALMRALPNMTVLVPQSPDEVTAAIALAMDIKGPCYIRVSRDVVPLLPDASGTELPFGGICKRYDDGDEYAIVYEGTALAAVKAGFDRLRDQGGKGKMIQVQTLKPFPEKELFDAVENVSRIIAVENHSMIGGLGAAIAEMLSRYAAHPPLACVGVPDVFTESGPTAALKARYGISGEHIASLVPKQTIK